MAASKENLWIEKGTSWAQSFGLILEGEAVDPSWTVLSQVRASEDSSTVLHSWSSAAGNASLATINHEGQTIPAVTITVDPATSAAWSWCKGVYDLKLTSPAGRVLRVLSGRVTVDPGVTR